jgi:hydroxymethylpyrimidine/phosphomethylpyrimidine kinase
MARRSVPAVLSIAGSDSGGGAGIQADLKAFAACGVHGMTALTALTAQNTVTVTGVHPVPPAFIVEQVRAVQDDLGVDAVKIGMLGTAGIVAAVHEALAGLDPGTPVVLDPVMVSESGSVLLDEAAREALVRLLLPRATVITPNVPEALVLARTGGVARPQDATGRAGDGQDPADLARRLRTLGPAAVIVTGGHRADATDVLFDGQRTIELPGERHPDGAAHGSGCTHSSALAAHLALGLPLEEAARRAKAVAAAAVRDGLRELGAGAGPVNALGIGTAPDATPVAAQRV